MYQHELATGGPDAFKTLAVAHNLGNILLRKNDLDGARGCFSRPLTAEPGCTDSATHAPPTPPSCLPAC